VVLDSGSEVDAAAFGRREEYGEAWGETTAVSWSLSHEGDFLVLASAGTPCITAPE
jgi:hypothetical protein